MKYLLKNKQTGEKILCDKVTKDGFDYYVSDEKYSENEFVYCIANGWLQKARVEHFVEQCGKNNQWRKVIATNNPNVSIPKVKELIGEVDVEKKVESLKNNFGYSTDDYYQGAEDGYKQALEDNKDKVFTMDDLRAAFDAGAMITVKGHVRKYHGFDEYLTNALGYEWNEELGYVCNTVKTEWEVEFVDGRLTLV